MVWTVNGEFGGRQGLSMAPAGVLGRPEGAARFNTPRWCPRVEKNVIV